MSYRIPERFATKVTTGTAVVAPLSGRLRLGIVLDTEPDDDRAREELRDVAEGLSLPADLVEVCGWVSEIAAVPLPAVLRAALSPGLDTGRYRILHPVPGWPWRADSFVGRQALKRTLGREGLRAAEIDGRIVLSPAPPARATIECAVAEVETAPDLSRAPRQRDLFEFLRRRGGACATSTLLSETGASRRVLRELVRRGAVRLLRRPEPSPLFATTGDGTLGELAPFVRGAEAVVGRGGAWLWRMPTREQPDAVAAVTRAALEAGEQALVLAPEIEALERLVQHLRRALPATQNTVAPYHSGLGRGRSAVYEAARAGRVDVVVGTRAAALLPLARLGVICVVDESNEAHRAAPGYQGLPVHVRDLALERSRIEGAGVVCLSPSPSLRLYAREYQARVRELPARQDQRWPSVRIVDVRGSGVTLDSTLLEACRRTAQEEGGRVGVVANRLGYATALTCNRCGSVRSCPECDLPLVLYEKAGSLLCGRCGFREGAIGECPGCGSERVRPTGLAVERVREELAASLGAPVGLTTASERELEEARVVVGTARCILDAAWDAVILPDADALLLGSGIGAAERAFRLVYRAAESARSLLLIQTRLPEHYALQTAARGDYPAFAAAELPRLRALGYPPFAHLASLTLTGPEEIVRRAVESRLRPTLEPGVKMSAPVLRAAGTPAWRVLLRSADRSAVARAGTLAARLAAQTHGLKARIDIDPEEV